ncbi:DUF5995 family protein [Intrasporangium sp.]|uniref:DUF5995 family protein n=1 Tax=Intrasporangium sp. TaxID=1925024 RepID=UPI0032221AC5
MPARNLETVVAAMDARLAALPAGQPARRRFLETYRRTTLAVGTAIDEARFEDPAWVERCDVVFADLYLAALDRDLAGAPGVPRPWRLAFDAPPSLPALRHVLLGINAHLNYDLPQALLGVIDDDEFADPVLTARRRRDHERVDRVLAGCVGAEDDRLAAGSTRTVTERVLQPLNRVASKLFLREARQKVWHNTIELHRARVAVEGAYAARLAELELLSAVRVADLLAPGQVLLRLSVAGFGVTLPPPAA